MCKHIVTALFVLKYPSACGKLSPLGESGANAPKGGGGGFTKGFKQIRLSSFFYSL